MPDCSHVDHNQLDDPLPFKIMYTNIVLQWLVYMILNGKGVVMYMGTILFPMAQSNIVFVTSAKEVMFSPRFVCFFFCLTKQDFSSCGQISRRELGGGLASFSCNSCQFFFPCSPPRRWKKGVFLNNSQLCSPYNLAQIVKCSISMWGYRDRCQDSPIF